MSSSPSIDANEKPGASIEVEARPDEYPSNRKGIVIMSALFLAAFLVTLGKFRTFTSNQHHHVILVSRVASNGPIILCLRIANCSLDQNIISTAIPRITDEFDSLNDVGWYGSAYLLTMCSFQLLMGKVYKFYPAKPLFIAGCVLFEVGSVVCGAAPSSNAFIVGRAIAGLGASGLFSGLMVIMFHVIPLQQRPIYQGCFGAVFAVASVIGPLVGGSFTDKVTWRWCFYINLPVGAISLVVTSFILHLPNQKLDPKAEGWWARVQQLDPIGNLVFFPGIVCLILALYVSSGELLVSC